MNLHVFFKKKLYSDTTGLARNSTPTLQDKTRIFPRVFFSCVEKRWMLPRIKKMRVFVWFTRLFAWIFASLRILYDAVRKLVTIQKLRTLFFKWVFCRGISGFFKLPSWSPLSAEVWARRFYFSKNDEFTQRRNKWVFVEADAKWMHKLMWKLHE